MNVPELLAYLQFCPAWSVLSCSPLFTINRPEFELSVSSEVSGGSLAKWFVYGNYGVPSPWALAICMKKPVVPGWIQMVWFIPVENCREKVIPSEVLFLEQNFLKFLYQKQNFWKFLYHLSLYLVSGSLLQHFRGYLETLYLIVLLNPNHILGVE